jgi:hypothetical protein
MSFVKFLKIKGFADNFNFLFWSFSAHKNFPLKAAAF